MNQFSTAVHASSGGARGVDVRVILDHWRCANDECENQTLCLKKRLDPVAMAPRCYQCGSRLDAVEGEMGPPPVPNDSPVREPRHSRGRGGSPQIPGRDASNSMDPYGPH